MNDRAKSIESEQRERAHVESTDEDRYAIDPRTGFEYVKRRPGEPLLTSEEVRKALEDFP